MEYPDGTKHRIYGPAIEIGGTLSGKRTFNFQGNLSVVDEKNNLASVIQFNPDERGFFKKIVKKNENFPDYIKGEIVKLTDCLYDSQTKNISLKEKHNTLAVIEGEWTDYLKIDNMIYWDYQTFGHYNLERDVFTIPSDSSVREDLLMLKKGNVFGNAKVRLIES